MGGGTGGRLCSNEDNKMTRVGWQRREGKEWQRMNAPGVTVPALYDQPAVAGGAADSALPTLRGTCTAHRARDLCFLRLRPKAARVAAATLKWVRGISRDNQQWPRAESITLHADSGHPWCHEAERGAMKRPVTVVVSAWQRSFASGHQATRRRITGAPYHAASCPAYHRQLQVP